VAVAFEARDPARLAEYWAGLLAGAETPVGVRFFPGEAAQPGPNRLHLHLTSDSDAHQRETVARALDLGGRHLDVGQRPEEGHVVLADPEGNAFCVIEPGNAYLAGCGFLGEVACDGTREVGLFWSAALGWPLVWDRDGETAVQSPSGGTKVAWSGTAPVRGQGRRQRFELVTTGDAAAAADRLVALGATRLGGDLLADPDGQEFRLLPG
jgi:catechol 2,3-dioxygenase-like lactoylglutathione lyase family enzyme